MKHYSSSNQEFSPSQWPKVFNRWNQQSCPVRGWMVLFGPHCWIAISPGTTHIHLNYVTTVTTHSLAFKINHPTSINAYVLNTYYKSIGSLTFIYIQPVIPSCADEGFTFSSKAHDTALALTDQLLGCLNFLSRSTRHFKFWFRFIGCWPLSQYLCKYLSRPVTIPESRNRGSKAMHIQCWCINYPFMQNKVP